METLIHKRTIGEIMRNFENSCLSCKFCSFERVKINPRFSYCQNFRDRVEHFNEGCSKHQKRKKLQPLTFTHLNYLLTSPLMK